jgi:hypothetical protein
MEIEQTTEEPKKKRTKKEVIETELLPITNNYCPNCQTKIRTDMDNKPLCPLALKNCPRNSQSSSI